MSRFQKALIIVLILQVIVIAGVYWPRSSVSNSGEPIFGSLSADNIVSVILDDKNGNHQELTKQGTDWQIQIQDGSYPAVTDKIKPVIAKLVTIQTNRLVTRTVTSQRQLQVATDDYIQKVQITSADGAKYILFIGSSPGTKATHVRLDGYDEVYLTDKVTASDLSSLAQTWIDTNYLAIPAEQIVSVKVKNDSGELVIIKDANNYWTLDGLAKGETVDTDKINALLNRFSAFPMNEPLSLTEKPEYGLTNPQATVTLTIKSQTDETKTITVTIGAKNVEKDDYIVKSSESRYYVKVASYNVQQFVENKLSDFLKPTPTASNGSVLTPTESSIPTSENTPTAPGDALTPTP